MNLTINLRVLELTERGSFIDLFGANEWIAYFVSTSEIKFWDFFWTIHFPHEFIFKKNLWKDFSPLVNHNSSVKVGGCVRKVPRQCTILMIYRIIYKNNVWYKDRWTHREEIVGFVDGWRDIYNNKRWKFDRQIFMKKVKKTFDIKINRKKLNIAKTCVLNSQFLWFFLGLLYLAKKNLF